MTSETSVLLMVSTFNLNACAFLVTGPFQHYAGKRMANRGLIAGRVIASAATTDNEQAVTSQEQSGCSEHAATSKKEQSGCLI